MKLDILLQSINFTLNNFKTLNADWYPEYDKYNWNEMINELEKFLKQSNELISMSDESAEDIYVDLIDKNTSIDILNRCCYDIFGKLIKSSDVKNHVVLQSMFVDLVRKEWAFELFPTAAILDSFEYLNDLWHDNEQLGSNNPDGTFKK